MSSTIASLLRVRRLKSALLPTFGRPTIATIGLPARLGAASCAAYSLFLLISALRARRARIGLQQLAHALRVVRPVLEHLDPQLEEHLALEHLLHLEPRLGADQLQHLPA